MQEAVIGSWRSPRSVRTLRLLLSQVEEQQELVDTQRKKEIGERIKELREESPYPQPVIARAVDVSLRAYQKWEAGGGISYDNAERLANFHGVEVDYILKGDTHGTTNLVGVTASNVPPNLEALVREALSRLEKLEPLPDRVAELEDQIAKLRAERAADAAEAKQQSEEILRAIRRPPRQGPPQ